MRVSSHAVYKVIAILIIHFEKKISNRMYEKVCDARIESHSYSFIYL